MKTKLDKDFNPIWLCKVAGLLWPSFMLLASVLSGVLHKERNSALWAVIAWCSFLLVALGLRYRSGKVGLMLVEFHFSFAFCFVLFITLEGLQEHGFLRWFLVSLGAGGFVVSAVRYVKCFYVGLTTPLKSGCLDLSSR